MNFKTNDTVMQKVSVPVCTVLDARVNAEAGEIEYLVEYTDDKGDSQQRWFLESQLVAA